MDLDQLEILETDENWSSNGPICGREIPSECEIVMMREENGILSQQLAHNLSSPSVGACFFGLRSTRNSCNRRELIMLWSNMWQRNRVRMQNCDDARGKWNFKPPTFEQSELTISQSMLFWTRINSEISKQTRIDPVTVQYAVYKRVRMPCCDGARGTF